jgi:regulatory LuxR family protein
MARGQDGSLLLILYDSFIHYFTPVYPDAIQAEGLPHLRGHVGNENGILVSASMSACGRARPHRYSSVSAGRRPHGHAPLFPSARISGGRVDPDLHHRAWRHPYPCRSPAGRSERTIKIHRASLMRKMGATSLADLIRRAKKRQHQSTSRLPRSTGRLSTRSLAFHVSTSELPGFPCTYQYSFNFHKC